MAFKIGAECNGCGFCVQWCPRKAIQGRRKQAHTIIAERCIECGACGRICGQRAVMDTLGRRQERVSLVAWPKTRWNYELCDGCGICEEVCPTGSIRTGQADRVIEMSTNGRPFLASSKGCISCGFCQQDCPSGAIEMIAPQNDFA